jgi:hypothetical protein
VRAQIRVQPIEHDARLHHHRAPLGVEFEHRIEKLAVVDHQCRTHRLAALRAARTARQDRHAGFGRDTDRSPSRLFGARQHHPDRLDLINGGIGGIAPA